MAQAHSPKSTPELTMPALVREVAARVRLAGGRAFVVGGAVRDALLGRCSLDHDLAVSLPPDRLLQLFPEADALDARLGTLRLRDRSGELVLTTFREESEYRDHRHPSVVRFVTEPEVDARRRDFTINAIYVDPETGAWIDPCGGIADAGQRLLRTIGTPARRFAEDPLRILRALRFLAVTGFTLEAATEQGLRQELPLLRTLSADRVRDELTRALCGPGRGRALRLLVDLGIAEVLLPEVAALAGVPQPPEYHPEGDVLTHCCLVLEHVPEAEPVLAWAAVLHDLGKPKTFERAADRIRFSGHDVLSATMARDVLRRLHASRDLEHAVVEVCAQHIRIASLPEMGDAKRERFLRDPLFALHLAFHRADCLGSHGKLDIFELAQRWHAELPALPPPPLCTGKDVLAFGVPAGRAVGEILRQLQARIDASHGVDRAQALHWLVEIATPYVKPG